MISVQGYIRVGLFLTSNDSKRRTSNKFMIQFNTFFFLSRHPGIYYVMTIQRFGDRKCNRDSVLAVPIIDGSKSGC